MTDNLKDTTPLIGTSDDLEAETTTDSGEPQKHSFGSVLLNTATGQEEPEYSDPDAADTTENSEG